VEATPIKTTDRPRVGIIGVGNLGDTLAARLLGQGFEVVVRDIRAEVVTTLRDAGSGLADGDDSAIRRPCVPSSPAG